MKRELTIPWEQRFLYVANLQCNQIKTNYDFLNYPIRPKMKMKKREFTG